jgi:exonuclease SbcC
MDGDIRNARTQLKNLEIDAAKATAEMSSIQSNIAETGKKISENELSLEKVEKYIAANQKDESIDGLLSLLKSQIAEWKTENASIVETSQLLESQKKRAARI